MRILIACPCPIDRELGAAQVHLNLAAALRARGHDAVVWALPTHFPGTHWTQSPLRARGALRSFLRREEPFDVVDCAPVFVSRRAPDPRVANVRWVARSTQPDALYLWETVRGSLGRSRRAIARTAKDGAWWAFCSLLACDGMSAANHVVCHSSTEKEWIGATFPWLRSKVHTYGAALSSEDKDRLALVRRARRARGRAHAARYIWLGRWIDQKGTAALTTFLSARLQATESVFTVAGCGAEGEQALAPLTVTGRVRVVPSYRRSELPGLLADHDAGLFTSRVEGWGLVLNEMVESGLPVYATRAGGVDEIRSMLGPFVQDFPPPIDPTLPAQPTEETFARYDASFSWDAVAGRYLEALDRTR
jgi:glycosyltransferase involved in cell wall biosynthesis